MTRRPPSSHSRCAATLTPLIALLFAGACKKEPTGTTRVPETRPAIALAKLELGVENLVAEKLLPASGDSAGTKFSSLPTTETGLDFVSRLEIDHPLGFLYATGMACGGVTVGDVDGDAWPDVFFTGGAGPNKLYRQIPPATAGELRFEDITQKTAGLDGGTDWGTGAALADIDSDGDLDLYVCNYDKANALFVNHGDGTFDEQAGAFGLAIVDACHTPAFCDYDGDGYLDLYILTNRYQDPQGSRGPKSIVIDNKGRPQVKKGMEKYYATWFEDFDHWGINAYGRADYLFHNDGGKAFSNTTKEAGIKGRGDGLAVTWWDYDGDGDSDLYISNDFIAPDRLYRNEGNGTFNDVIGSSMPHTAWFSMGADFADVNNDGRPDILTADMSATNHFKQKTTMGVMGGDILRRANTSAPPQYMRNAFLINTGTERFLEGAHFSGIDSSDWTWAVLFADLDLDGLQDVYMTNGTPRAMNDSDLTLSKEQLEAAHEWEYAKKFPVRKEKNRAFKNLGDLRWDDASDDWGLGLVGVSYAAAHADFDRDGDLDLVALNVDDQVSLFRNDTPGSNRALIKLIGQESNRHGIGARVEVVTQTGLQVRQIIPDRGYMGGVETVAHFGLGAEETIDELVVRWPSGAVQRFESLPAGAIFTITEANTIPVAQDAEDIAPFFTRSKVADFPKHVDPAFDDFSKQPLLPSKLSSLGPCAAWGDIDNDGDDDLFVGNGAGEMGSIWINEAGQLTRAAAPALADDAAAEDMGAIWFDADSDGDLDLYVASGSYEFDKASPAMQDRLYLNDGTGALTRLRTALPKLAHSSSCVSAADFDRDGDIDLFVGSRVIPGEYPLAPDSILLRNDSDADQGVRFVDVTAQLAPELKSSGLVTAALWSDADGDGWIDLLVAFDWGPVRLYANRDGKLADQTETAGLAGWLGWWNSIAGRDLDGDGDIDYVVGNVGTNTKYHAHPEKPVLLFYGDYAGDGQMNCVEAEYEGDVLYPIRGKSCSTRAMPWLSNKFKDFRSFAASSLQEIYTPTTLDQSSRFEANTLESGVLINAGGKFEFRPLPHLAQISPAFGIVLEDFDADGACDIFLAQNFFGPQAETGRFDGGMGQLLLGDGSGGFEPVWAAESGIVIQGDMTAATATDLNRDGRPDLLVARNSDTPIALENSSSNNTSLAVRLSGASNAGARITLHTAVQTQTAELNAGSGYLSQSPPVAYFGLGDNAIDTTWISVRWPDGSTTEHRDLTLEGGTVVLSR